MRLQDANSCRCHSPSPACSRISRKSWPAQKPRPSPRRTTTRTVASVAMASSSPSRAAIIDSDKGLNRSPRLRASVSSAPVWDRVTSASFDEEEVSNATSLRLQPRHLLLVGQIELLVRYILIERLLRPDIETAAIGIGVDVVGNAVLHAHHEAVGRQAVQHGLPFGRVGDLHRKSGSRN